MIAGEIVVSLGLWLHFLREHFPIEFLFLHTDHKSISILDDLFVDEALLRLFEAASPIHLGDNPKADGMGHVPIMHILRLPEQHDK